MLPEHINIVDLFCSLYIYFLVLVIHIILMFYLQYFIDIVNIFSSSENVFIYKVFKKTIQLLLKIF